MISNLSKLYQIQLKYEETEPYQIVKWYEVAKITILITMSANDNDLHFFILMGVTFEVNFESDKKWQADVNLCKHVKINSVIYS